MLEELRDRANSQPLSGALMRRMIYRVLLILVISILGIISIITLELIPLPQILRHKPSCIGLRCSKESDCGPRCACVYAGAEKVGRCIAK
jgi:hypothetical protein